MVKKNKILIGCLSLLLVLSVGYALFSETITINGTATAKGSFDITTTCTPGYSDEVIAAIGATGQITSDTNQGGFENSICNVNGNTVTMSTDLFYPTANRGFTIKMINTGSIPAVIWVPGNEAKSSGIPIYEENLSWTLKNKETNEIIKSGEGAYISSNTNNYYRFISYSFGGLVVTNVGEVNSDKSVIYDSIRDYVGIKLDLGDILYLMVEYRYPNNSNYVMSDNGKSEYFEFKLNHEFKWEQYVENANYESTTFDEWCFSGC